MKNSKKAILKLMKGDMRKAFMEQGGHDGRFVTKVVSDKKKTYNRQQNKRIDSQE